MRGLYDFPRRAQTRNDFRNSIFKRLNHISIGKVVHNNNIIIIAIVTPDDIT